MVLMRRHSNQFHQYFLKITPAPACAAIAKLHALVISSFWPTKEVITPAKMSPVPPVQAQDHLPSTGIFHYVFYQRTKYHFLLILHSHYSS